MRFVTMVFFVFVILVACREKTVVVSADTYYKEQHRPRFHFSPEKGWMNDPNGLVYYDSTYHLFYQHYPDSNVWGPMHWGHATSRDLIHWKHQPIALYPDSLGYIFSGSAVVDDHNTSGLQQKNAQPLVAVFTHHDMTKEKAGKIDRESQSLAYSLDNGKTWTKYSKNPVLKNKGDQDFRDPKVFFHQLTKKWIMALAVGNHLEIFSSPNLIDWKKESDFGKNEGSHGGVWECPDLFPLKTKEGTQKWVLIQNIGRGSINGGSGTQYFIGSFDGHYFKNDNPPSLVLWLDYGADNYAGVTWFGAPDNRRLFIGWMSNWDDYAQKIPTQKWRSALTVPRELGLRQSAKGIRLIQYPVKELSMLRVNKKQILNKTTEGFLVLSNEGKLKDLELEFDLSNTSAQSFGLVLSNTQKEKVVAGYDLLKKEIFIDRTQSGKNSFSDKFANRHAAPYLPEGKLKLRILIDVSSIELFVDDGALAMTDLFFPTEDYSTISLFSEHGKATVVSATWYDMLSIWNKP